MLKLTAWFVIAWTISINLLIYNENENEKKMRNLSIGSLLVLSAVLTQPGISSAAIDKFEPYAYAMVLHDTNIFRQSENEEDDTIGHLGAGFRSDYKLSRQHLLFNGEVDRAQYDSEDQLDHTRVKGNGTWEWQLGNLWSGSLGATYQRRLSSFDEQPLVREKDMRTEKTGFLNAGYQIHPDWRLAAGISSGDTSFQDRKFLDRTSTSGSFQVLYSNTRNSQVGARVSYSDYDLKNTVDVAGASIDNDYQEIGVSGVFYWEGSAKSTIEASLGYTETHYEDFDDRDYQGTSGRLIYHWILTGKTKLDIEAWRETSTLDDEITSYVLTKGISISPVWSVTPLIDMRGSLSYTNDDFKAQNEVRQALGFQQRDDDTWRLAISTSWRPRKYLSLSVGYRYQDRSSSIDNIDYTDNQFDAKIQAQF
ncbi:outer membrane beta-barrel protein [Pseudomonadota bacterium]